LSTKTAAPAQNSFSDPRVTLASLAQPLKNYTALCAMHTVKYPVTLIGNRQTATVTNEPPARKTRLAGNQRYQ